VGIYVKYSIFLVKEMDSLSFSAKFKILKYLNETAVDVDYFIFIMAVKVGSWMIFRLISYRIVLSPIYRQNISDSFKLIDISSIGRLEPYKKGLSLSMDWPGSII
jgi:hypothetical protein